MKSKKKYILASGIGALVIFLTSLPYLLKNYIAIPALNIYIPEEYIYVFCIIFFPAISIFCGIITYKQEKYDILEVVINWLIAFIAVMSLKAIDFAPVISLIAVGMFVLLSLIYLVKEIVKHKAKGFDVRKYFSNLRYVFALIFSIMMIPSFISYLLIMSDKNITEVDTPSDNKVEMTIEELFSDEKWEEFTIEDKYEAMKLGISYLVGELRLGEIEVRINDSPLEPTIHAKYNDIEKYIQINENYLLTCEEPKKIFRTLCHESFHYYQYQMMDLYFEIDGAGIDVSAPYFDQIRRWVDGYNGYMEDREDYDSYLNNELEQDANAYADEMIEKIFGKQEVEK